MKSAVTSTLFLSAQVLTCFCITSLAPGTQWSQKPMFSLPAAPAVRMCTSGSATAAAPSLTAERREIFDDFDMEFSLSGTAASLASDRLIQGQPCCDVTTIGDCTDSPA